MKIAEWELFCGTVKGLFDKREEQSISVNSQRVTAAPSSIQSIVELFKIAKKHKVNIHPMGNERRVQRSDIASSRKTLVLDLKRLNQIIQLDDISSTVRVQSGVVGQDLEDTLNNLDYTLGDFPKSMLQSTVGGMLSVRTSGKLSRRHGTLEDSVVGLTLLAADGQHVTTHLSPRRSSGPDLARFFCGSEGELGIITECTLKIFKASETHLLTAWSFDSIDEALMAARLAIREEACPAELVVYSREAAAIKLPDLESTQSGGYLFAVTSGPTDLANCDRELIQSAALAAGGKKETAALAESWWNRSSSSSLTHSTYFQCACTPGHQAPVIQALEKHAKEHNIQLVFLASQFDIDGTVMYIGFRHDTESPKEDSTQLDELKSLANQHGAVLAEKHMTNQHDHFVTFKANLDPEGLFGQTSQQKSNVDTKSS